MDIPKMRKEGHRIIEYMEAHKYGKVAKGGILPMLNRLFEHEGEYDSYYDFYEKFINVGKYRGDKGKLKYYKTSLRHIQAYDEYGVFPNRLTFSKVSYPPPTQMKLNEYYMSFVMELEKILASKMLSNTSIGTERNILIRFLYEIQENNITRIEDITDLDVNTFFFVDGSLIRKYDYACKLKRCLNNLAHSGNVEWNRIANNIPSIHREHNLIDILPDEDVAMAREALLDEDDKTSYRDKAMISIAMYTGMRGSDIANLTIDDIDWVNERITLIQSKTGQKLILPLRAVVGNSIYDYLKNERPENFVNKNLFFNEKCDGVSISSGTVGGVIERFFTRLGLKCEGKQRRLRILRHYLASKLLHNGNMPAVISGILGHIRSESLDPYIDEDIENMRTCALDVSMFPIENELFQ